MFDVRSLGRAARMSLDTSSPRAFILSVMELDNAFIVDDFLVGIDGLRYATVYSFLGEHLQINSMHINEVVLYNDGRMAVHDTIHDVLVEIC